MAQNLQVTEVIVASREPEKPFYFMGQDQLRFMSQLKLATPFHSSLVLWDVV